MGIILSELDDKKVAKLSYTDVKDFISALNALELSDYDIGHLEDLSDYVRWLTIIRSNIDLDKYDYGTNVECEKENAKAKLKESLKEPELRITPVLLALTAASNLSAETKAETKKELENAQIKADRGMMARTISVIGVFSAIITIIMSLVMTSSSWLNNADGASAMIAFLVPSLVAVFSICTLMLIIYAFNSLPVFAVGRQGEKVAHGIFLILLIVIIIGAGYLLSNTLKPTEVNTEKKHYRIEIPESGYAIDNNQGEDPTIRVFFADGQEQSFVYDDSYLHDDVLYFCTEHDKLE